MKGDLIKDFHDLLVASTFKTSKVDYLISFLNTHLKYLAALGNPIISTGYSIE